MNFLVYLGLRNYDLRAARTDLAERASRLLMKSRESDRAVYENYNAITSRGNDVRSSGACCLWSASLAVLPRLEKDLKNATLEQAEMGEE